MNQFVLAIDQGTTSTRAVVFDASGRPAGSSQKEHQQHFPQAGWVEHDALEIWRNTREVIGRALADADIGRGQLAAVGLTNQRETTVVWDRSTGRPVHRAIVWQDTRTQALCEELAGDEGGTAGSRTARAFRWPPTSPGRRSAGSWTMSTAPGSGRRPVSCSSAPWTPGCCET